MLFSGKRVCLGYHVRIKASNEDTPVALSQIGTIFEYYTYVAV